MAESPEHLTFIVKGQNKSQKVNRKSDVITEYVVTLKEASGHTLKLVSDDPAIFQEYPMKSEVEVAVSSETAQKRLN